MGFDSIATTGEEARDPSRSIPIATITSMTIVTLSYMLISGGLTLMVPFWEIKPDAALSDAFARKDIVWAQIIIRFLATLSSVIEAMWGMQLLKCPRLGAQCWCRLWHDDELDGLVVLAAEDHVLDG